MLTITFTGTYERGQYDSDDNVESIVTHEVVEPDLSQVVEHFERFLKGVGFMFDDHLDFTYDDEPLPPEEKETER